MNGLVIDAGIALKAILANSQQALAQQKLAEWKAEQIILYTPSLWWYEVTSTLTKAVFFKPLTQAEAEQALSMLHKLNVHIVVPDEALVAAAMAWTFRLKRAAAYDSFYLALAQQLNTVLWTADKKLFNAVQEDWVCYLVEPSDGNKL